MSMTMVGLLIPKQLRTRGKARLLRDKQPYHRAVYKVSFLLLGLLFFGLVTQAASSTFLLTKEEALTRALERNLRIKIERSQVDIAKDGIDLEKGAYDPEIRANFETTRIENQDADSLSVSAEGLLPTGGTYGLNLSSDESFAPGGGFNSFAGATFRQPLLRNFGLSNSLAALRIARRQFDLSEWEYKQMLLDTLAATIFAFNDLYEAQQNLVSSERSRDLAQQLVNDNNKRVELGVIAPLDIISAEAQLATRIERVLQVSNVVRRGQNRLKQLIFDNAEEALAEDIEAEAYREPEIEMGFAEYLVSLLESSPDFRIGEIALEIARLRMHRDKNQALPSLDFIAQYGFSGSGSSLEGSLDSAFSGGEKSYTLGAAIRYPILNRSARAQRAISEHRERIAEIDLQRLRQAIQLEFHTSFEVTQTNFRRVEATRQARELAERSLEAEEKKLNAGTSSTFFVLRLQNDLSSAELREISATTNYNRSVAEFNRLRGVLE